MPNELRQLFATILVFGNPTNPMALWDNFKAHLMEDFVHRHDDASIAKALTYSVVNEKLSEHGKTLAMFDIHLPPELGLYHEQVVIDNENEQERGEEMYKQLNENQQEAADQILALALGQSLRSGRKCFFIDGPAGTGKTFLYSTLCNILKGQGKNSIVVAWTGIAATLLPGGRTMHSQFKLPLHLYDNSTCNLNPASKEAETIREAAVIFWDEAPMAPNCALKAIDIALQDIMRSKEPFGGKIMVLGGDFRQVLPVTRFASRAALIASSLKASPLWDKFNTIRLHQNMRTGPGKQEFSQWLLCLGNGDLPSIDDEIDLPASCLTDSDLIDEVFGQEINTDNIDEVASKVILCPKNEDTLQINNKALQRIPGPEKTYTSIDKVICENGEDPSEYPEEFLYSLTPTGMPPHKLILKVGAIVMLLRNLNIKAGLCNGT
uniref:ATP-dependent DNA helicase n=1 Tax=Plectus sambesii TaxID=2011161 RepID=A0A914V1X4_9BILA